MSTTLENFEHRLVKPGDVNIHAVIGGEGPPLVLLHGWPQTWWEWRKVMPELRKRHTVIALDLRGAGYSDSPETGYDKATMADDVHGAMQALGFQRYDVCGHDIGAMVALALAFKHRDAVTHLAILDAPLPGWSQWEANLADPKVWHFAFHMKRDLPERLIQGREFDYVSTFFSDRTFNHGAFEHEDIEVFARAMTQPGKTRGGLEWYRAFPTDHANGLGWKRNPLTIPVLALGGEHRYGVRMVSMLQEFATNVSGGSIADCAHWVPEERPLELTRALLDFLGSERIS
ncbi:alpha/beta fold hydrolase [Inquilinus sp. Marseille-Q2685]|uniref:alpha/beta fold hydrolase n=1 Tax=Inquilinus sp. Marseille-Q2685 TaxID=2866581 RepID=UPI001CE405AF|nr:alpha/beta hydrolase [Inquilinus sp. Marseille-Q2685]